jgi:hypothetical protein
VLEGHVGASKTFYTYLLPWFLLENTQKTKFQTSNLLAFQNKWFFFMGISSLLAFKSNLCHIIWTWKSTPKNSPKISPFLRGWGWFCYENKLD